MKLAAHQPCYLPSLSFFYKLQIADMFVLADDYQYTTNHAINRTRIKTAEGGQWLTVPVLTHGKSGQFVNQVSINTSQKWWEKHFRTLHVNYVYAAYFEQYVDMIELIYRKRQKRLIDLNLDLFEFLTKSIGIDKEICLSSDLSLNGHRTQKLLNMLERTGCDTYLSGIELSGHLDPAIFQENRYSLEFLSFQCPLYHQQFEGFIKDLSVVDLLFNEGPESGEILHRSNQDR